MANPEVLTLEDLEALDSLIPSAMRGLELPLVTDSGPLTREIMEEGAKVPILPGQENILSIDQMRTRQHRIAQLLASGLKETTVARMVGFTQGYISNLKRSPAFVELMAHYSAEVQDQFAGFVERAGELSERLVDELSTRLDEKPEAFSINQILEAVKTLADRSGNAPVARSLNVNTNVDLGTKLAAARARALAAEVQRILPPDDGP